MKIKISVDNPEREQFESWLVNNGHEVESNNTTGNYVDGVWTSTDERANETFNDLWDQYCNADTAAAASALSKSKTGKPKAAQASRANGAKGGRPIKIGYLDGTGHINVVRRKGVYIDNSGCENEFATPAEAVLYYEKHYRDNFRCAERYLKISRPSE